MILEGSSPLSTSEANKEVSYNLGTLDQEIDAIALSFANPEENKEALSMVHEVQQLVEIWVYQKVLGDEMSDALTAVGNEAQLKKALLQLREQHPQLKGMADRAVTTVLKEIRTLLDNDDEVELDIQELIQRVLEKESR